jgi:hypothetical protein
MTMEQERRTWPRSEAPARVFVVPTDAGAPVGYKARNLSAGGALLSGGPVLHAGRELKLMLPLNGRELVLHARVLRADKDALGGPLAALAFRAVPTFVQDLIQNHVLRVLELSPTPAPIMPPVVFGDTESDAFDEPAQGNTPFR